MPQSKPVVVVGVGDAQADRHVLVQAFDLAIRLDATLLVAHVEEPPVPATGAVLPASGMAGPAFLPTSPGAPPSGEHTHEPDEWVPRLADDVATECGFSGGWTYRAALGEPGHTLADLAVDVDAYCLAVGSRGESVRAALSRLLRPSVSRSVLRARAVPVLVVPQGATTMTTRSGAD